MLLEARGERFSRTRFAEKYPIANEYAYPMRGIARKKRASRIRLFQDKPSPRGHRLERNRAGPKGHFNALRPGDPSLQSN